MVVWIQKDTIASGIFKGTKSLKNFWYFSFEKYIERSIEYPCSTNKESCPIQIPYSYLILKDPATGAGWHKHKIASYFAMTTNSSYSTSNTHSSLEKAPAILQDLEHRKHYLFRKNLYTTQAYTEALFQE